MRKKTEKKPASYLDVTSIRIDSLNLNLSSFVKYMQRRARARAENLTHHLNVTYFTAAPFHPQCLSKSDMRNQLARLPSLPPIALFRKPVWLPSRKAVLVAGIRQAMQEPLKPRTNVSCRFLKNFIPLK
jgi:hypothetical protein